MLVNILSRPTKTYENIDEDSEVIRQRNTYETYLTTSIDDYASFSTLQKIDISLYKLRVIDNYYAIDIIKKDLKSLTIMELIKI